MAHSPKPYPSRSHISVKQVHKYQVSFFKRLRNVLKQQSTVTFRNLSSTRVKMCFWTTTKSSMPCSIGKRKDCSDFGYTDTTFITAVCWYCTFSANHFLEVMKAGNMRCQVSGWSRQPWIYSTVKQPIFLSANQYSQPDKSWFTIQS